MTDSIKLSTVGELLAEPPEEEAFIVDELLPLSGSSLLVGGPKAGKSTLAESLTIAMAQHGQWLGRECRGGGVVMLAFESKRGELRESMRRGGAQPDDSILIKTGLPNIPAQERPQDWLEMMVFGPDSKRIESPPVLVIVDTLARLTRIGDGNDYYEVTDALAELTDLARRNDFHLMLIHHSRKGGGGAMEFGEEVLGSTAMLAAVDTGISIRRDQNTGARMIYSIGRYGQDLPLSYLVRDDETGLVSLGVSKAEATNERIEGEILDFVAAQTEPVTLREIEGADDVNGSNANIRKAVKRLSRAGRLTLTEGARRGSWRYRVPHLTGAH